MCWEGHEVKKLIIQGYWGTSMYKVWGEGHGTNILTSHCVPGGTMLGTGHRSPLASQGTLSADHSTLITWTS